MCGSTTFTIYNVDQVPDVDVMCLTQIMKTKNDVDEYKAMMNGRK